MTEQHNVHMIFRYRGLRSYIDLDLCARCPRLDQKGCCGHYSPVFYLLDLAYLHKYQPELLELVFSMPRLTVLDHSVTINKIPDTEGFICPMLDKSSGCRLPQSHRESVCRHFICGGVGWNKRPEMRKWADFFEQLGDLEIAINNEWAERISASGLSLRNSKDRPAIYEKAASYLEELLKNPPPLLAGDDYDQDFDLLVEIDPETEWLL